MERTSIELRDYVDNFINEADKHFKDKGYGENYTQNNPELLYAGIEMLVNKIYKKTTRQ